jgi:pimeloyl-ACP methyl ester carboxylesterase
MDYIAARGYDVFALTIRGYGLSSRPPEMERDPASAPPAVRARTATRDVEAAVRFIREHRGANRLSLLGWAQGTMLAASFAAAHPEQTEKIVLFSPLYLNDPSAASLFEDPEQPGQLKAEFRGAWRWVTEEGQQWNWSRLFPRGKSRLWRETSAVRAYWDEQLKYDSEGMRRRPRGIRIPNGLMADHFDRTRGRSIYDPAKVKCPVLLIRGEHDLVSEDKEAQRLFQALTRTSGKRYAIIGDATHFVQFEKRREELFREVQGFLEV